MISYGNPETLVISFAPPIVGQAPPPPPPGPDVGIFFGNPLVAEISFAAPAHGTALPLHGATYRLIEPHWQNNRYFDTNAVITTSSNDGMTDFPSSWIPTPVVDPLNTAAVNAFYAAGPRLYAYEVFSDWPRIKFANNVLNPPVTFWKTVGLGLYALTGLGAGLPPRGP